MNSTEAAYSYPQDETIDLNNPATFKPTAQGVNIKLILRHASCRSYLIKHVAPTFSFIKTQKKRYVVLVDRMLYTFKNDTPDSYREFFELTKHTHAFVTDQFSGELFCLEISKTSSLDTSRWFLQADDADTMKLWLSRIKNVIAMLNAGETGTFLNDNMNRKESDAYLSNESDMSLSSPRSSSSTTNEYPPYFTSYNSMHSPPPSPYAETGYPRYNPVQGNRPFNGSSYKLSGVLPPQLPPPKTLPPPLPASAYL
jgi:hypothetical protein